MGVAGSLQWTRMPTVVVLVSDPLSAQWLLGARPSSPPQCTTCTLPLNAKASVFSERLEEIRRGLPEIPTTHLPVCLDLCLRIRLPFP